MPPPPQATNVHTAQKPASTPPEPDVQAEVSQFLVDRYAPPAVVVDGQLRIQRSRGRTGPYLELPSGEVSLDILRMVRRDLLAGLRGALNEGRIRDTTARKENLRYLHDGQARMVNLEVTPIGPAGDRLFLVVFDERPGATPTSSTTKTGQRSKGQKGKRTAATSRVEEELAVTRDHLQSTIRELAAANEGLQSANEEILSSNEELQSTNEELDTAKEELQSTNEELSTLNDELESRNLDLTNVNSDLHNLLATINVPIVIVSADLRIRRFTPAAERTWNLIPTDTGRPIGQVRPNFECPGLEALIAHVIETVIPVEREVADDVGRRYALRVRPYKSLENKIDGAVLTLFDVTDEVALARSTAEAIMSTVEEPVALLDGNRKIQLINPAFVREFGIPSTALQGQSWEELVKLGWDPLALRTLVEEVLPASKRADLFAVDLRPDGAPGQRLLVDGRWLQGGTTGNTMLLLTVRQRRPLKAPELDVS